MPKAKNIPVARGTVVHLRESRTGKVIKTKGIVMRNLKPSAFSRAYGRQVAVCVPGSTNGRRDFVIYEKGAGDLFPVGKVKRIPKGCATALAIEKKTHPQLFGARKTRRRRR